MKSYTFRIHHSIILKDFLLGLRLKAIQSAISFYVFRAVPTIFCVRGQTLHRGLPSKDSDQYSYNHVSAQVQH